MGVELDRDEALRWMAAMTAGDAATIAVDVDSGVYGHRVSMADHSDDGPGAHPAGRARSRVCPTGRRR